MGDQVVLGRIVVHGLMTTLLVFSYYLYKLYSYLLLVNYYTLLCNKLQSKNHLSEMGSSQTKIQHLWDQDLIRQLKLAVQNNIKQRRLQWDRQTNIYQKTQFLVTHFANYKSQIDEILLAYNIISEKYMQLLPRMDIQNIQVIKLSYNNINCDALKHIKTMKCIRLKHFFLDNNQVSNDGCFYIMRMSLPMLQTLDVSHNLIENQGAGHLSKATLPNLRTLLICQNKITQKGLMILGTGQWPLLAFVRARKNPFSQRKDLQFTKFRTQIKCFRLQVQ